MEVRCSPFTNNRAAVGASLVSHASRRAAVVRATEMSRRHFVLRLPERSKDWEPWRHGPVPSCRYSHRGIARHPPRPTRGCWKFRASASAARHGACPEGDTTHADLALGRIQGTDAMKSEARWLMKFARRRVGSIARLSNRGDSQQGGARSTYGLCRRSDQKTSLRKRSGDPPGARDLRRCMKRPKAACARCGASEHIPVSERGARGR
jgi:hypothetical protein